MADWDHTPDIHREARLGFDEAVLCSHKRPDQLRRILLDADQRGQSVLLTRLSTEQLVLLPEAYRERIDYDNLSCTGIFGSVPRPTTVARVAVVSAGSSDAGVAAEAVRTLRYYGEACHEVHDVGVAGLWRLLERVDEIRRQPVVIVVAGMDAALPSVLGGLVPGAIIAVPVSTGYGVAAKGQTALNAALTSCAPGLMVVNIDNGYGAACAALRITRSLHPTGRSEGDNTQHD